MYVRLRRLANSPTLRRDAPLEEGAGNVEERPSLGVKYEGISTVIVGADDWDDIKY